MYTSRLDLIMREIAPHAYPYGVDTLSVVIGGKDQQVRANPLLLLR